MGLNGQTLLLKTGFVGTANSVTLATLTTSKVVIDGSQAVSFTTGAHSATLTVDATAATGVVTVDGSKAVGLLNVNGGAGNDVIMGGTIGGLIYGTLMTLFVIPCVYDIFNRKKDLTEREE